MGFRILFALAALVVVNADFLGTFWVMVLTALSAWKWGELSSPRQGLLAMLCLLYGNDTSQEKSHFERLRMLPFGAGRDWEKFPGPLRVKFTVKRLYETERRNVTAVTNKCNKCPAGYTFHPLSGKCFKVSMSRNGKKTTTTLT